MIDEMQWGKFSGNRFIIATGKLMPDLFDCALD